MLCNFVFTSCILSDAVASWLRGISVFVKPVCFSTTRKHKIATVEHKIATVEHKIATVEHKIATVEPPQQQLIDLGANCQRCQIILKPLGGGRRRDLKMLIKWRESCGGGLHISFQNGLPTFGGYGGERRRCWWEGGSSFSHPAQWDQWEEFWDFISWKWRSVKRVSLDLQCSGTTLSQRQKSHQMCFSKKLILSLIEQACGRVGSIYIPVLFLLSSKLKIWRILLQDSSHEWKHRNNCKCSPGHSLIAND